MKQTLLIEIFRRLKANPNLMRRAKGFALVAALGLFVTGGVAIWVGVSAINYFASYANQVLESPVAQAHVGTLKAEMKGLLNFQPVNCWTEAQGLFAVQPWLERPALGNLESLKVKCFEQKRAECDGADCAPTQEPAKTAEGRII